MLSLVRPLKCRKLCKEAAIQSDNLLIIELSLGNGQKKMSLNEIPLEIILGEKFKFKFIVIYTPGHFKSIYITNTGVFREYDDQESYPRTRKKNYSVIPQVLVYEKT